MQRDVNVTAEGHRLCVCVFFYVNRLQIKTVFFLSYGGANNGGCSIIVIIIGVFL